MSHFRRTSRKANATGLQLKSYSVALKQGFKPLYTATALAPKVPKALRSQVAGAIKEYEMIREGDRLLVGLSGGKDTEKGVESST